MTLDPQAKALLEKVEESGILPYEAMTPKLARQFYEKACEISRGTPPVPHSVKDIVIPGPGSELPARCYHASNQTDLPLLVFFHGGGFTIGSVESHDAVCRHLCVEAHCLVVSVDYRLAPEHKFPAAAEDAYAASCWIAEHGAELGGDPRHLAVAGDSAGGNLAAVTCLTAREKGFPAICHQVLIYPGTDMTESFPSHQTFGQGYLLTSSLIEWFHHNYLTGHPAQKQSSKTLDPAANPESAPLETIDLKNWRISPLHAASHENLPAAHLITAGFDPLQDEGKAYADTLQAAGVEVSYQHYPGMLHGFITQPGFMDQAKAALSECAKQLRSAFSRDL